MLAFDQCLARYADQDIASPFPARLDHAPVTAGARCSCDGLPRRRTRADHDPEGLGEAGSQHRLRVRMTRVTQDRRSEPAISAAVTIDYVCALVRAWLEGLLDDTGR